MARRSPTDVQAVGDGATLVNAFPREFRYEFSLPLTLSSKACEVPSVNVIYTEGGARSLPMGRVDKGVPCSVSGCSNRAERSISRTEVGGSGLIVKGDSRRVYLCHDHYKAMKKATKKNRSLERSRW